MRRRGSVAAAVAAAALLAAGCGSSSSSSSSSNGASSASSSSTTGSASASTSALGTAKKATGSPYVFGLINDETGPVTFPEARQAEMAAADYVNNYMGGINGHPIQLATCISDASPATSARCATQLADKKPLAILGAADVGSPAAIPVYARAGLAYLGGIPFTPVEQKAPNSVQFWSVSLGDNAAAAVYAVKQLGVKNVAILYFDNPQGKVAGLNILPSTFKAAGATTVKTIAIPPTTPDATSEAAAAVGAHPDAIYVDVPNGCGAVLKDIKSLGFSGKILGIDPCTDPRVISAAAGGAENMYVAVPFVSPFQGSAQGKTFLAAMQKYAAPNTAIDSIAEAGFATVMNVQQQLSTVKGTPTTKSILAAFKSGTNHPNYMSHPYTCNGQSLPLAPSICGNDYLMEQIKGGKPVQASTTSWVTSTGYFKGL
jgi:branched-chain amino acid transport system substrate-binding protein